MDDKRCTSCRELKPATEFHKNRSTVSGLASSCKECMRDHARNRAGRKRPFKARKVYPPAVPGMKYCRHCDEEKPLPAFYKSPVTSDGHASWCRDCINAERLSDKLTEEQRAKRRKPRIECRECGEPAASFKDSGFCRECFSSRSGKRSLQPEKSRAPPVGTLFHSPTSTGARAHLRVDHPGVSNAFV